MNNTEKKLDTLKPLGSHVEIRAEVWGSIVDFVLSHRDDITNDINDYGELLPIWEFMNRDSNEKT